MNKLSDRIQDLVLLAAAAVVIAGCGGKDAVAPADVEKQAFEDLRTEIREAIDDSAREAEALAVMDALSKNLAALRASVSERNSQARKLNANYDTPRADFEALFDQIYTEIRANRQRVAQDHHTLMTVTTPEEWAQISKSRTKAMQAAISTMQID
jgi:predicted  nucleic acid-binding Zn-ribbon protein